MQNFVGNPKLWFFSPALRKSCVSLPQNSFDFFTSDVRLCRNSWCFHPVLHPHRPFYFALTWRPFPITFHAARKCFMNFCPVYQRDGAKKQILMFTVSQTSAYRFGSQPLPWIICRSAQKCRVRVVTDRLFHDNDGPFPTWYKNHRRQFYMETAMGRRGNHSI